MSGALRAAPSEDTFGRRHVVHPGRLRHRVWRDHVAAGLLRRVCGRLRNAAAVEECGVQPN